MSDYLNELGLAETWIYNRLTSDPELVALVGDNIYQQAIDDEAQDPYPAVLFAFQSGADVRGNGPRRYLTDVVYVVKVIGRGSVASLRTIAGRIDAALNAQGSGDVAMCVRTQPLYFPEREGDTVYQHLGGYYRLRIVPKPVE